MSGKTFNIITGDSETGAQNEPQPPVTHQEPQEAQEAQPTE